MEQTYHATYTARGVFLAARASLMLAILGGASIAFSWFQGLYAGEARTRLVVDLVVVGGYLGLYGLLWLANRVPSAKHPNATGCWARVANVFDRSRTLFEMDVARNVTSAPEAFDRIAEIRDALLKEAKADAEAKAAATLALETTKAVAKVGRTNLERFLGILKRKKDAEPAEE
jgi:hypothetical protein